LTDDLLCLAVAEMERGLIDADLGRGVFKKRVALLGKGKRGSVRTLIATNRNDKWFFVLGFEKNDRANITTKELEALQLLAGNLLALKEEQLRFAIADGALLEVTIEKAK
jgi:hypothetical protein